MTDYYTRPDVAQFLAMINAMPGPKIYEIGAPAARQLYNTMRDMLDPPIGELAVMRDFAIPGPAGDIPARLYDAESSRGPGPVMVYYHGGGFTIGGLDSHASFCAEIARTLDLPVVAIDYRKGPEHPFPAATDDSEAAARWVAGSPAALGRDVTGLVLSGDSAGGNLTIVVAMQLRDRPAAVPIIAQLPIYPVTDYTRDYPSNAAFNEGRILTRESMEWFQACYAPVIDDLRVSPQNADLAGMPPAIVLTAGLDPLRDQGRAYAAKLAEAGVPVSYREAVGNVHGFVTARKITPSSANDIVGFLAVAKLLIAEASAAEVGAKAAA